MAYCPGYVQHVVKAHVLRLSPARHPSNIAPISLGITQGNTWQHKESVTKGKSIKGSRVYSQRPQANTENFNYKSAPALIQWIKLQAVITNK